MVAAIMWRIGVGLALLSCVGSAVAQESGNSGTRGPGRATVRGSGSFSSGYPRSYGNYHALLIGVGDYNSPKWKDLGEIPENDVLDLEKQLTALDFRVSKLLNQEVTREQLSTRLREYQKTLTSADNLLIWFAGHGTRDEKDPENWAWVMHDGKRFQYSKDLEDYFERSNAHHLLVISDSCFAGVTSTTTFHRSTLPELNRLQKKKSRQLMTSGDVQEVANSGVYRRTGKRSPFAFAFLNHLKSMNAKTPPQSAWQVFDKVSRKAIENQPEGQESEPRCGFLSGNRYSNGQFFFVHPGFFERQLSREDARKRTRLTEYQWDQLTEDGVINGKKVYYHRRVARERDAEPMVLVDKTYVTLAKGVHESIEPFLIDVHEVTVRQFKAFLADSGERRGTRYLNLRDYDGDEQPIVGVTLAQARAYASWAGKQLPDPYQWLAAAARTWQQVDGKTRVVMAEYPWSSGGKDLASTLVWNAYPPAVTSPTDDISPWGVERMGTGVREWCLTTDRSTDRGVIRGGTVVRASSRDSSRETWRSDWSMTSKGDIPRANVGFRCIVPLDKSKRGER